MRRLSYLLALGSVLLSCKDPTQVMLQITTDLDCPSTEQLPAGKVRLVSVGIAGAAKLNQNEVQIFNAETSSCETAGTVGSLVLVPAEGRDGDLIDVLVVAAVEGAFGAGTLADCETARKNMDTEKLGSCIVPAPSRLHQKPAALPAYRARQRLSREALRRELYLLSRKLR